MKQDKVMTNEEIQEQAVQLFDGGHSVESIAGFIKHWRGGIKITAARRLAYELLKDYYVEQKRGG